jgi:undecaprenyl-diphosphatase
LSIPAIVGAAVLQYDALVAIPTEDLSSYLVGFIIAAIAGWFAIKWLVLLTQKLRLAYFAAYTAILAVLIFAMY